MACFFTKIILFVLGAATVAQCIVAQSFTCEEINRGSISPQITLPSVCAGIVDYPIGLFEGMTQNDIELGLFGFSTITTALTSECKIAVNTAVCSLAFPKCTGESIQPIPCQSICLDIFQQCTGLDIEVLTTTGLMTKLDCTNSAMWSTDEMTCNAGPSHIILPEMIQQPYCAPYTGSVCAGGVPDRVYIPAGMNEAMLEGIMRAQQFTYALAPQSTRCDRLHQAWTCSNVFHLCAESPIPGLPQLATLVLPRPSCKSFCEDYTSSCEPFFAIDPAFRAGFQPDCDAVTNYLPTYPEDIAMLFPTANGFVTAQCSNWSSKDTPTISASAVEMVNAICPFPLVLPDPGSGSHIDRIVDGACALSCPIPTYTIEQYQSFDTILITGAILSLITTTFYSLTWLLFRTERKTPFHLYMNLCLMLLYLSIIIGAIRAHVIGAESLSAAMCKNNVEEVQFEGFCAWQGLVAVFACMTALSWWLVQAIDIFRNLVLDVRYVEGSLPHQRLYVAYHVFAWVPPSAITLFLGLKQRIGGYTGGMGWCFISNGRYLNPDGLRIDMPTFFYPMITYTVIGSLMMFAVMVRVLYLGAHADKRSGSCWDRYMCNAHIRIFLFLYTMMFLWCFLFAVKMVGITQEDNILKSLGELVTCALVENPTTGKDCLADYHIVLTPAIFKALQFFAAFCGFLSYFFHAISAHTFGLWMNFFYENGIRCCPSLEYTCCRRFASAKTPSSALAHTARTGTTKVGSGKDKQKDKDQSGSAEGKAKHSNSSDVGNSNKAPSSKSLFKKQGMKPLPLSTQQRSRDSFQHSDGIDTTRHSSAMSRLSNMNTIDRTSNVEMELMPQNNYRHKTTVWGRKSKNDSITGSYLDSTRPTGSLVEGTGGSRILSTPFRGWETGSFNGGGNTFGEDFNILRGNISTISPGMAGMAGMDTDSEEGEDMEDSKQNVTIRVFESSSRSASVSASTSGTGSKESSSKQALTSTRYFTAESGVHTEGDENQDTRELPLVITATRLDGVAESNAEVGLDENDEQNTDRNEESVVRISMALHDETNTPVAQDSPSSQ